MNYFSLQNKTGTKQEYEEYFFVYVEYSLVKVIAISANVFLFRFGGCRHNNYGGKNNCSWYQWNSVGKK